MPPPGNLPKLLFPGDSGPFGVLNSSVIWLRRSQYGKGTTGGTSLQFAGMLALRRGLVHAPATQVARCSANIEPGPRRSIPCVSHDCSRRDAWPALHLQRDQSQTANWKTLVHPCWLRENNSRHGGGKTSRWLWELKLRVCLRNQSFEIR